MSLLKIPHSIVATASRANTDHGFNKHKSADKMFPCSNGPMARMREQFQKIELSASSYDTAWVAVVPSPMSPTHPCFPQCVNWILDNQHPDGSWGLQHFQPSLIKDCLSSTLACILALVRWKVGEEQVRRGLNFIESNFSCIMDEQLQSPIGFDIIFPGMLEYAINIGIDIPVDQSIIYNLLSKRDAAVQRYWMLNDEEIHFDIATCAMAFRLLRMNGYSVSSDCLSHLCDANYFNNTWQGYLKDVDTVLELYKASQVKILPNEETLDKLGSWSRNFLQKALATNQKLGPHVSLEEVEYVLSFPIYSNLERLEHKRNIEIFNAENLRVLKTSYQYYMKDCDFLALAIEDFHTSQSTYREELQNLENWIKENKLDQLEFARQKQIYCYFSAAATLFSPEMSDARISWAKNSILTTVVDDFFDLGGSRGELDNLISLVKKWDVNWEKQACSEQVKIIFSALFNTINELGMKASRLQKRDITHHLVEIWLNLMESMMKEAQWLFNKQVPSSDEYMMNAYVSFALGPIILPALYFVGPELPEETIRHPEYDNLFTLVSTCGRFLNDIQGFEREGWEGKLNSVSLRIHHTGGSTPVEEVKQDLQLLIESSRTKLLGMVLQQEESVVPKPCKDLFWKMCKILHLFYMKNDGFSSPKEMVGAVSAVIHEPLKVKPISASVDDPSFNSV